MFSIKRRMRLGSQSAFNAATDAKEGKFKMKPEVIFENQHYQACVWEGALIISHKRKRGGKQLVAGKQADEWIDAIKTAIDASEANALCRGFLA